MMRTTAILLTCLVVFSISHGAARAEWPSDKPIEMIVPFGPGGGTDIMARTLAPFLEKRLNAKIVVINKPGASGEIALGYVASSVADGYTLAFVTTPSFNTIHIGRNAQFRKEDLQLVARLVNDPSAFVVRADRDIKTVKDLVDAAKKNPKTITIANFGPGGDDHLAALKLERVSGAQFIHVPYNAMGPVMAALLGGHITVGSLNVGEFAGMSHDADKLRMIGQMSEQRWGQLKDIPTFKEQGFDVLMGSERGLAAPRAVKREIIEKMARAVESSLKDAEFLKIAEQQKLPLAYLSADQWTPLVQGDAKWLEEVWKETPWR